MPVIDCDGMAEWEVESSDDIKNILLSDEYHQYIAPDEEKFLDRASLPLMIAGTYKNEFTTTSGDT